MFQKLLHFNHPKQHTVNYYIIYAMTLIKSSKVKSCVVLQLDGNLENIRQVSPGGKRHFPCDTHTTYFLANIGSILQTGKQLTLKSLNLSHGERASQRELRPSTLTDISPHCRAAGSQGRQLHPREDANSGQGRGRRGRIMSARVPP